MALMDELRILSDEIMYLIHEICF